MADYFVSTLAGPKDAKVAFDWSRFAAVEAAKPAWTPAQALFAVLFAAATCDGDVSVEEQETLIALVHRSRALKALDEEALGTLNIEVVRRLAAGRDEAVKAACAAMPKEMRLAAFAHALDIAIADGDVSAAEAGFLNGLILSLELAMPDVERVADVLLLKNSV